MVSKERAAWIGAWLEREGLLVVVLLQQTRQLARVLDDPALVQDLVRTRRQDHDPFDMLSPREREVLALMAEGRSNAGIARRARAPQFRPHERSLEPFHLSPFRRTKY